MTDAEKEALQIKLHQLRLWFCENAELLKKANISVVYSFSMEEEWKQNVTLLGTTVNLVGTLAGIGQELLKGADDKKELIYMFISMTKPLSEVYDEVLEELEEYE